MKRHIIVAIGCLIIGSMLGGGIAAWGTAELRAQPSSRWEVERHTGFMFIRDTETRSCYLAVEAGSIITANCGMRRR